jgi:hypothetical protein
MPAEPSDLDWLESEPIYILREVAAHCLFVDPYERLR